MGHQRAAEPQSQARAEGRGVLVPIISLGLWPGQDVQEPETPFTVQLELGCWGVSRVRSSAMAWGQMLGGGSGGPSPGLASLATVFPCHGLDVGMVTPACRK